jgi:hypothetical protein
MLLLNEISYCTIKFEAYSDVEIGYWLFIFNVCDVLDFVMVSLAAC